MSDVYPLSMTMGDSFGTTEVLESIIGEQLGVPVIWLNPNAPRLPRPFCTLNVLSDTGQPWAAIGAPDSEGIGSVTNHFTVTLSLSLHMDGSDPRAAVEKMRGLRQDLDRPSLRLSLHDAGWAFVRVLLEPQDMPEQVGTRWEYRAGMDLEFRVARQIMDEIGRVQTVIVDGQELSA